MDWEETASTPPSLLSAVVDVAGGNSGRHSDNDNGLRVRLRDVIPCNIRNSDFLQSQIDVTFDRDCLRTFLRCYGFIMHNRDEKVGIFAGNKCLEVREVAQLLGDIRDMETFRETLHDHMSQARSLMTDDVADALNLNDDDANEIIGGGVSGDTADTTGGGKKITGRELLALSRESLDHVLQFVQHADQVRRAINVNEYCRQLFERDASNGLGCVSKAWFDSYDCDLDTCVSVIIRDVIVSTGMETHNMLMFIIRTSLLFTFLVTQTVCSSVRSNVVVTVPPPAAAAAVDTDIDEKTREYFDRYENVTVERFIATVFVSMSRMCFVNFVEWPCRLNENDDVTIDLNGIRATLLKELGAVNERGDLRWLRVLNSRIDGPRLYVKSDALVSMLERVAQQLNAVDAMRNATTNGIDGASGGAGELVVRGATIELKRQYEEYESQASLCATVIANHLRTKEYGLSPYDYATVSPRYIQRGRGDDDAAAAATTTVGEDDRSRFVDDIGRTLLHGVLALVRHDIVPYGDRFDSIHYRKTPSEEAMTDPTGDTVGSLLSYDDKNDSYSILLAQTYSHVYRVKMSVSQTQCFFRYMVDLWNEQFGVSTFEQLGGILITIYRMFPYFNDAAKVARGVSSSTTTVNEE